MFGGMRALLTAVGGLMVFAAVLVGAWYFFIREDPEDLQVVQPADVLNTATSTGRSTPGATSPAAASASAASAPSAPAGATAFSIVGDRSEAAYFAPEKLASLPTSSTAKGATKQISGTFYLRSNGIDSTVPSSFTVTLTSLTSDQGMRDRRVQSALETSRFPTATFSVTSVTGFPATIPSTGTGAAFKMTGILTVHGVKKEVTWDVALLRDGNLISALAKVKVRYDDFGMQPPNIGGFVSVEDSLELQIQVVATAQ